MRRKLATVAFKRRGSLRMMKDESREKPVAKESEYAKTVSRPSAAASQSLFRVRRISAMRSGQYSNRGVGQDGILQPIANRLGGPAARTEPGGGLPRGLPQTRATRLGSCRLLAAG